MAAKQRRKRRRKEHKRLMKSLETKWWEAILDEAKEAEARGDGAKIYQLLKKLGLRGAAAVPKSSAFTAEEFREHFEKVSAERHENTPDVLRSVIAEIPERVDDTAREAAEELEVEIKDGEVLSEMKKMKNGAPGEDGVKLSLFKAVFQKIAKI